MPFKLPSVDRVFLKMEFLLFLYNFMYVCMYVFIFGCAGSLLLCGLFFSLVSRGYSVAVMLELLTEVASLAVEHRLNICGTRT